MVDGGIVNSRMCVNFARNVQDNLASGFCSELAQLCTISGMIYTARPLFVLMFSTYFQVYELKLNYIFPV